MAFSMFIQELIALLNPHVIFTLAWSTLLGITVGALPGLTAVMTLSLLVGLTYSMDLSMAMTVLMGVFVGGIYGASKSAILLGIPGTSAASATVADGYALAKQGQGGPTIGLATVSSTIGTLFGMLILVFLTPMLSRFALQFQTWEYFLLGILGVVICGNLASKIPLNGWVSGFTGLLIAMIGLEKMYAYARFSYGDIQLMGGISFVPAMIGLFGMAEVIDVMRNLDKEAVLEKAKGILPHMKDVVGNLRLSLQSGVIGVLIGIIPGAGEDIAAWVSYDTAQRTSKTPEKFGHGSVEGVIAAETANNSAIGGALIPILSLAIPGSPAAAVMLSAMWLHGIRPGPLLFIESPSFIYHIAALLFLGAIMILFLGLLVTSPMNKVLMVPKPILMPIVMVLAVLGSFAINMKMFDVYTMFFFGILGYFMRKVDVPPAPMVLGLILGPMVDTNLRRGLSMSGGSLAPMFGRPITLILIIVIVLMLLTQNKWFMKKVGSFFGSFKKA